MKYPTEVKIAGFGGQGIVLAGTIIGRGAAIYDGKHATLTRSFGPEARGGASSVQLVISEEPVHFPYVTQPDVMAILSQGAYSKFIGELGPQGILITEEDLVQVDQDSKSPEQHYRIPATRFAEEMGRKVVLNIIAVGCIIAVTGMISAESARKAVKDSVPKGTEKLNLEAFDRGYRYGMDLAGR